MSFLTPGLHEQQRHAEYFLCRLQHGPTVCLACFLHSLADPSHLESRKLFTLREFMNLVTASDAAGSAPILQGLLTQHASLMVDGFLQAMACTQDIGLAEALHEAAANMCQCASDFLPELFTERLLQLLLQLSWPQSDSTLDPSNPAAVQATAAVASCLQLLDNLISSHSSAAGLLARILQECAEAAAVMTAGLSCEVELVVVPLLHIFTGLVNNSAVAVAAGSGGCLLAPGLAKELYLSLLLLLPNVYDPELKALVAQLLLRLAETGFAVEQLTQHLTGPAQVLSNSQQNINTSQQAQQQQQEPASIIMRGLKVLLLDTNMQVQLLGTQVLVATAVRAPAALLQQLMTLDVCEHVFEVLRGTLSSCSIKAKLVETALNAQQRKQGPGSSAAAAGSGVKAAAASAAVLEFEVVSGGLQSAAVAALRCLASQGHAFMEHFHCGLDPLIGLLQHATARADSPLLADTLLLIRDITAPQQPTSMLLPAAALAKLVAAAAAVLPESQAAAASGSTAVGEVSGSWRQQQQQQVQELQPSPELQAAYQCACDVITHVCVKWGSSSSSWVAMQPPVVSAMHKALAAVSLLSSRSLAEGFMTAAARLTYVVGQQLLHLVSDRQDNSLRGIGTEELITAADQQATVTTQVSYSNQRKPGSKGKQGSTAANDKPFAKQRRQQRRLNKTAAAAAAGGTASQPGYLAAHQSKVDDVLLLMESLLLHLIPAACRLFSAVSSQLAAAAASQQQQQEGAVFVGMLEAVHDVLMMVLSSGSCSSDVACFLPSFCSQLMRPPNNWCSVMWTIMEQHALPPAAANTIWTVLLLAAANLEGAAFMAGIAHNTLPSLAANISKKATCSLHLLQLLCTSSNNNSHDLTAAGATASQFHYGRNSSRQAAALAAAADGTSDIRRFCGLSDIHRAAICIVAAAVRAGDCCWSWLDILTALDAAVESAGPGVLSQPELLCNVVQLYAQVEEQLAADMVTQQLSSVSSSDSVLLTDWQQPQQQYPDVQGSSEAAAGRAAVVHAVQQLPVPAAILHALQKLGRNIPNLQAGNDVAVWILARAVQLPTVVQQLLQRWLAELLPLSSADGPAAASKTQSNISLNPDDQRARQQADMCALLTNQLVIGPAAVSTALQLAKHSLENNQQLQLSGWLSILTGVLLYNTLGNNSSGSDDLIHHQQQQQQQHGDDPYSTPHQYLTVLSHLSIREQHSRGADDGGSSSTAVVDSKSLLLQNLLFGSSGLLELLRRALLTHLSDVDSSMSSSVVVLNCSNALLAAISAMQRTSTTTAAAAAAGCGSESHISRGTTEVHHRQAEEQLLQHGIQQVQLLATRLIPSPYNHPLRHQLLLSAVNTAAAILHVGLLRQHDTSLLQQLAVSQEVQQLVGQIAAAATDSTDGGTVSHNSQHQSQGQQVEGQMMQCSSGEAEAVQLIRAVLARYGVLCSSLLDENTRTCTELVASSAAEQCKMRVYWPASRENLLQAALQYHKHLQLMALMGLLPAAGAVTDPDDVLGLNAQHMLLLAQNTQGRALSVTLLHSLRMLLQLQAAKVQAHHSSGSDDELEKSALDRVQWQHWNVILSVLQNMVTATAAVSLSSTLHQEAPVSCLSALYCAAAASLDNQHCHSSNDLMCSAISVAKSSWNKAVAKAVLDRLCQSAVECKGRANEAEQAAALIAAAGAELRAGYTIQAVRLLQGCTRWLCEPECQQQVQLLCADAQLLLDYIKLLVAVARLEHVTTSSGSSSSSSRSNRQSLSKKLLGEFQQFIVPYLEQQQLVPMLCWAAARLTLLQIAANSCNMCDAHQDLHMHAGSQVEAGLYPETSQYQQQRADHHTLSVSGGVGVQGASQPVCLQLCLSEVALQLLAGLIDCGCLDGQLPWLHQQLQQQMWVTSKLQQDYQLPIGDSGRQMPYADVAAAAAECGTLLSLSAAAVSDGQAVGGLRPCVVHLLLQAYQAGQSSTALDCETILGAVESAIQRH